MMPTYEEKLPIALRIGANSSLKLFFLDGAPSALATNTALTMQTRDEGDSTKGEALAWEDSDDERVMVSLASNPRLRKLRLDEAEDIINGKEYCKRLRQQFERLYPVPEWANPSSSKRSSKKKGRRQSSGSFNSASEASSADEMDVDEALSTEPLATLLQNADDLILREDEGKRRKLRPEVLDIQRTKDVGNAQPVSFSLAPTLIDIV